MINNSDIEASLKRITDSRINGFMDTFSKKIINNEASLFIGAGVSHNSGLPSWAELLQPCADDLGIELTSDTNLYDVSQYYVNKHNDNSLRRIVSERVNKLMPTNTLLNALMEIGFAGIWTTNFDQLVERVLASNEIAYNAIYNDKSLPGIDKYDKVNIYKINGDISDAGNMILTRSDYEQYENKFPLFLTFLKRELVANTFLFVGYGFNDYLILDCLNTINQMIGSSGNIHYALLPIESYIDTRSEHFIDDLKKRYGIECLLFKRDELTDVINALNRAVKERKVFISGAYDSVSEEADKFADALSENLVSELLDHEYRISTGIGKRLGTYVTVYAHRYLAEKKIKNTSKY
ncbi:MAG: SIR2 family protein, partial [Clostridiales bacterium]|nr:SIR2 family protein [Clostridiales bacterium]